MSSERIASVGQVISVRDRDLDEGEQVHLRVRCQGGAGCYRDHYAPSFVQEVPILRSQGHGEPSLQNGSKSVVRTAISSFGRLGNRAIPGSPPHDSTVRR